MVLSGGSFTLGTNGRIVQQPPTQETKATRAPSLTVNVTGTARIAGTIDLSGGDGLPISNALQHGESGGNLDVFAADIDVTGALFSNGGDGVTRQFGFPAQTIAAGGGSGGRVRLVSRGALDLGGTVHADGGRSPNTGLGGCFDGGDGGTLELHHAGTITLADPTLGSVGGTTNTTFFCDEVRPGSPGWAQVVYRGSGPAPTPPRLDVPEVESNDGPTDAQPLMYLSRARVVGTIANGESPELSVGAGDGSTHDIYDWYAIGFPGNERLTLTLDHATSGKRLGVVVGRADPDGSTAIVGGLVSVTPGEQIVVEFDNTGTVPELAVGPYVVGITMNRLDAPTASYTLTVAATPPATSTPPAPPPILSPVPDADGDGVLDADDNCQAVANPTQLDTDGDDLGNACDPDDDGDGMSDAFETEHGLDPLDASDATRDDDGDSLINRDEAAAGTDPTDADTDGDGVSDGAEIAAGRNPTLNEGALAPLLQMILER